MNRRKFLKSIGNFLAAIPFLFLMENHEPAIWGIDEASQSNDYTGILLFNNVSQDEFEIAKEDYIKNIREHKFTVIQTVNRYNCTCRLEWIETE